MVLKGGKIGFDVKFSETPKITRSMLAAIDDLKLDNLFLIYEGHRKFSLNEKISAVAASNIFDIDI